MTRHVLGGLEHFTNACDSKSRGLQPARHFGERKKRHTQSLVALAGLWTILAATWAADAGPKDQPAAAPKDRTVAAPLTEDRRFVDTPDERVSILSNGLTVILKAHRTAPVVSVRMYCRTGSIYEQEYLGCGMSHLFEHLLHGAATTTCTEEDAKRILDEIGGNSNAYTSYDATCYYIDAGREHLATAVGLLGDWLMHPTWPQEAFDREWAVVQRELERDADNPDRQLFYLTMETMYRVHPIRYPVIGYKSLVQTLKKEDIVGYYHRMYVPDDVQVCIVGDINLDEALAVVQKDFAAFARRPLAAITLPQEPEMATPRQVSKRMKVEAALLQLAWPSVPLDHPDLYALDVLSFILTQGESSRLVREVRDRGLVYSIESSSWTPSWARGLFTISTRLAEDKVDAAVAEIGKQIERVQSEPVSAEELEQAKRQKAAEHVFSLQIAGEIAENLARDYQATGDIHFSRSYVDNIQKLTAEQIRDVARRYLVPRRLGTIKILPQQPATSTAPATAEAGPEPARKITLDNGLRCLIQRDPTAPLVAIQVFSLGGVLFEDAKTNGLSQLVALLAPRGTEKRSAEQIARFFDSRGGMFGGNAGNNTVYFAAQVLKGDFADALEVVADVVCHPTFPQAELDNYRPRVLDEIRQINETWRSELMAYLDRHAFPHSPYRFPAAGSLDVVAKATREDVAAFYRRQVTGGDTVVAIFGDVDPAVAESLTRRYFGSLPAGKQALPSVPAEPARDKPVLYVKAKPPTRAAAGVGLAFEGMTVSEVDDVAKMAVLDTIISGYRYPTGWLMENLRGKDRSLVYEVHAINRPGPIPGAFEIYAACEPTKVNEVYRIISQQLDRARAGQFTPPELERAKTIIATTELMGHQTAGDRAMQAALDELYGLGWDNNQRFIERVRAATLDDVRAMAVKYFTAPVVAVVTAAPDQVDIGTTPAAVDRDQPAQSGSAKEHP